MRSVVAIAFAAICSGTLGCDRETTAADTPPALPATTQSTTQPATQPAPWPEVKLKVHPQANAKQIELTWEKVDGADGYFIFKVVGKQLELLHHTKETSFVMTDNLTPGRPIEVKIVAAGPLSGPVEVASKRVGDVPDRPPNGGMETPTLKAAGAGPTQVTLTFAWGKVTNATGYRVEYQKTQAPVFGPNERLESESVAAETRSFTFRNADRKQIYRFRVVPTNALGEGNPTSWRTWRER